MRTGLALLAALAAAACASHDRPALDSTTLRYDRAPHGHLDVPLLGDFQDDRRQLADLVRILCERGTDEGVVPYRAVCTLEEFFTGLRSTGAFAANVFDGPVPRERPDLWFQRLAAIRGHAGVTDVLVWNIELEPFEGGVILDWPYSDSVLVYTTLPDSELAELFEELRPSEIMAARKDHLEDLQHSGFPEPSDGERLAWVWWD